MLALNSSSKFKKDFKTCIKRGYNMKLLEDVGMNIENVIYFLIGCLFIVYMMRNYIWCELALMQIYLVCRNAYDNNNFCYFLWHIETCEKIAE